jgi:hypothetical protein
MSDMIELGFRTARFCGGSGSYVQFLTSGGVPLAAHRTPITRGVRSGDVVQVTSGVRAGELVITSGGFALADGLQVKITAASQ